MHLLAVFDADLAHPPAGLFLRDEAPTSDSAEERICRASEELSRVLSLIEEEGGGEEEDDFVDVAAEQKQKKTSRRQRRETTRLDLTGGEEGGSKEAVGFAAERCARSHVASRGGVHVVFARAPSAEGGEGEDAGVGDASAAAAFEWPGFLASAAAAAEEEGEPKVESAASEAGADAASLVASALADAVATATDPAEAVLDFYESFASRLPAEAEQAARVALSQAKGGFAFVVYDANERRLVAARDPLGLAPLSWGVKDGLLMLSSDPGDLAGCEPTAVSFGPGTMFVSEATRPSSPGTAGFVMKSAASERGGGGWPGRLLSFVPVERTPEAARALERRRSLERRSMARQATAEAADTAAADASAADAEWRGVRAVPRLSAEGVLCGAVYRVASSGALPRVF